MATRPHRRIGCNRRGRRLPRARWLRPQAKVPAITAGHSARRADGDSVVVILGAEMVAETLLVWMTSTLRLQNR
jgi:hypothetical protein